MEPTPGNVALWEMAKEAAIRLGADAIACVAFTRGHTEASFLRRVAEVVARAEREEQLRQAIETMEPIDREVLALRHFEELTNQETAEVLGIRPKAASVRYVRALRRLKAILAEIPAFQDETRHA